MLPIVTQTQSTHEIQMTSSYMAQYGVGKPSSKRQAKDEHSSEIQYEFQVEDDLINPSYHQMPE